MGALIKVLDETRTRTSSVVLQQHLVGYDDPSGGYYVFVKRRFRSEAAARRAFETARSSAKHGGAAEIEILREAEENDSDQQS